MVFDTLKNCAEYYSLHERFEKAFDFIKNATATGLAVGKYEIDGKELYASVQEYNSKSPENGKFEAHKNYIDIQYIVSGIETMGVMDISKATSKVAYNPEKDVEFYEDSEKAGSCVVEAQEFGIFFPWDVHKPGLAFNGASTPVKKIVVKVKM